MTSDLIVNGKLDRQAAAERLRTFLEESIRTAGLALEVSVLTMPEGQAEPVEGQAEVVADLEGKDKQLLLERNGEVLKAIEHLAFKALRLEPTFHEKVHIDCGGYRSLRFEELRMTARVAAENVKNSKQPFKLNPMSSRERRIVHLALKEFAGIRTESSGMGDERQVVIIPAEK